MNVELFFSKIIKTSGCWLWNGNVDRTGYGYFSLKINNKRTSKKAHRIAYALHTQQYNLLTEPYSPKVVIAHRCNNKLCCNPDHLEMTSAKQNSLDALEDGLYKTGEQHTSSKLTNREVALIRQTNNPKMDQKFAEQFRVSKSLIQKIRLGYARKHG